MKEESKLQMQDITTALLKKKKILFAILFHYLHVFKAQ